MDYRKIDKDNNMVKMTIKRTDDSTEVTKWVCERIDDDPDSAKAVETVRAANKSVPAEDENLNDGSEHADNWYDTIPSYLEIDMKEGENQEPSRRNSTENIANISMTHCPASSSHEAVDSADSSFNDPMDLSTRHSKLESQRDVTNVSKKSPPEAHASKSKFLGNVYAEGRNASSSTGFDRITQGETVYPPPGTVWSQNAPPMAFLRRTNPADALAMPTIGIPSISYNFPRNYHGVFPVSSGFVNTGKPEITMRGNIPHHLTQDVPSHPKTNYKHVSTDTANYGHCGNEPHSNENRSYSWSLGSEGNFNATPLRNVFAERTGDNFVNNLPKNHNNLKRPSKNCVQMESSDASKLVCPPRKKQSHGVVPNIANYCNVCDRKFKNAQSYNTHRVSKQHLKNMKEVGSQQSNSYNFQPNSEGRSLGPTNLQAQLPPHALQVLDNNMWYNHLQARAMIPAHIPKASKERINNTNVQISGKETSKTYYNEESLGHIRSQNYFGTKCYPHNPIHMNLPVSHTNNPQGIFLPPNPQSENSMMANPKYLENKASQSSQAHKNISVQIQPEGLTVANSFQKSGDVPSVTHHQEDLFRIFHCMVCSVFKTDFLQELDMHINADRSRTPLELVMPTDQGLVCQLCGFKSPISVEMARHCTSEIHLNRVRFYNHVREGGLHRTKNIFTDILRPVWVFCAACEYVIESIVVLKVHASSQNHQINVSNCKYIESFGIAVEYCCCRPCNLNTLTKRELLIHARSKEHQKVLQEYLSRGSSFRDPSQIFYIKKLSKPPKVSEQNEGSTSIGGEEPQLRKEKNKKRNTAENQSSVNLSSASSTSQQPRPVSCSLCQQVFTEISALVQHLQQVHGVNEEGVKFLVSIISSRNSKLHEEISLPETKLTDTNARKMKSTTFWPEKSSVANEELPLKRMNSDSFSYQSSVVTGQNKESESSGNSTTVRSGQNVATDKDLNQERKTSYTSSTSSSQQFNETEGSRNAGKLDQNPRLNPHGRTCIDLSSSKQFNETEGSWNAGKLDENPRSNPHRRTCIDPSSSQEFYETEGMRNPDLHQERRIQIDSASRQQFCKTKNILPVEEKNVPDSEERRNSDSSRDKITVENDPEPDGDSKYEIEMDDTSSDQFSSTETGSLVPQSVFNTSIESNDSYSSDDMSAPYERYTAKEKPISSAGRSMANDSSANQHDALDSQNTSSSLEHQPNLNLRRNVGNYSSTKNLMASVEPKRKANDSNSILVNENSGDSVNDRMESNDRPNEAEEQFCAQNSPASNDSQLQAMKNIENIEISGVFSLRGHIDISSNTDEDEETSDCDIYSDL